MKSQRQHRIGLSQILRGYEIEFGIEVNQLVSEGHPHIDTTLQTHFDKASPSPLGLWHLVLNGQLERSLGHSPCKCLRPVRPKCSDLTRIQQTRIADTQQIASNHLDIYPELNRIARHRPTLNSDGIIAVDGRIDHHRLGRSRTRRALNLLTRLEDTIPISIPEQEQVEVCIVVSIHPNTQFSRILDREIIPPGCTHLIAGIILICSLISEVNRLCPTE